MSDVTLSAGVRQNLLSLQQTSDLLLQTQNRLATGKSVNSALDNPTNFFTSESLSSRAGELSNLLDSIGNATKTIEAADNGITAITSLVQSAQSTVNQAINENANSSGVQIQGTFSINTAGVTDGTTTKDRALNQTLDQLGFTNGDTNSVSVTATNSNGTTSAVTVDIGTGTGELDATTATVSDLIDSINGSGVATASVTDDGRLNIESSSASALTLDIESNDAGTADLATAGTNLAANANLIASTVTENAVAGLGFQENIDVTGTDSGGGGLTTNDDAQDPGGTDVVLTDGSTVANANVTYQLIQQADDSSVDNSEFVTQFNEILDQIDELARDASFNGVNLINSSSSSLTVSFNEERGTNESSLSISGADLTSTGLSLSDVTTLDSTEASNSLDALTTALSTLQSTGSRLGSNLNTVTIREDFTKAQINTLQTGADNLVLADTNEEGANLLALQTRQSLSTTALSLSAQADQAVLRLL